MNQHKTRYLVCTSLGLFLLFLISTCGVREIEDFKKEPRLPEIFPDYTSIILPPNLAPLNFEIQEEGEEYIAEIVGTDEEKIQVSSSSGIIKIPEGKWKKLLAKNMGKSLVFRVFVLNGGQWYKFGDIENKVANEEIDSHLSYRLINPGYVLWEEMGIYQRNMETFTESPIFVNKKSNKNCMNCHSYCMNNPEKMVFHMRANPSGTLIIEGDDVKMVNTGTEFTMSAGVYPSWHPNGNIIAFSINKIKQQFHAHKNNSIHVSDRASDLVLYIVDENMITTSPKISTRRRENLPTWSPDGKHLYFVSAPEYKRGISYDSVWYDLMRIEYDVEKNKWGKLDTLIDGEKIGRSVTFPRVSPDGKFLVFAMSDYGYFNIHNPGSDIFLMDLETMKYKKMDINSDFVDSYPVWSTNNRWILFGSKRLDKLCTRPFICYIDQEGNAGKPFVIPQKDPGFYKTFIRNYNRSELMTGPVSVNPQQILAATKAAIQKAAFDPDVDIDALSGATRFKK